MGVEQTHGDERAFGVREQRFDLVEPGGLERGRPPHTFAMRSNEEVLNKTYAHHLGLDFPDDIKETIRRNYEDEQRHLAWVESALRNRIWEGTPAQP